ncbi:MAG: NAD+ synthase [Pseudomonadota bacterium]|nr:NAD+ synthase [Pseudomonadota bacterium]
MKITIAQLNNTVGDIDGNIAKALEVISSEKSKNSDLIVFSELFISGYPPEDLVLKDSFLNACYEGLEKIVIFSKDINNGIIIGAPIKEDDKIYNCAVLIDSGKIIGISKKKSLPNYSVFDEKRVFDPGETTQTFDFRGIKIGIPICEDIWKPNVCNQLKSDGADIIITPNGSQYDRYKRNLRIETAIERVKENNLPLVYVNQVGGQDELVFDGSSFVINSDQSLFLKCSSWTEEIVNLDFNIEVGFENVGDNHKKSVNGKDELEDIYSALVLGLKDYVEKNNFPGVILGLSGGIDSALCAAISVDALGSEKVKCFMLPFKYTSKQSFIDATECAKNLNIELGSLDIENSFNSLETVLTPFFNNLPPDVTEENLQSRIRGTLLMALSNKVGKMVVTTGNKSEVSVGYSTLYGDMNGGYNPIKDIYKTEVYELSKWRNSSKASNCLGPSGEVIPFSIIEKEPTAELREDQKDQDSLPPYDKLDDILESLIDYEMSISEIVKRGHDKSLVKKIENLLYISEYKRRQSAPGVKVSQKNFGRDRRYPITNLFRDKN